MGDLVNVLGRLGADQNNGLSCQPVLLPRRLHIRLNGTWKNAVETIQRNSNVYYVEKAAALVSWC